MGFIRQDGGILPLPRLPNLAQEQRNDLSCSLFRGQGRPVKDRDQGVPAVPAGGETSAAIGSRVAAVLAAAEEAAANILADARAEAERLVRQAEERGQARYQQLTGEPERLVAEAQAKSERLLAETAQAVETQRREAEDAATALERETRKRQAELAAQTSAIYEEREQALGQVEQTLTALRDVSSQLEAVLGAAPPVAEPPRRSVFSRRKPAAPPGDGLYEALHEGVADVKQNGSEHDDAAPKARAGDRTEE